MEINRGWYDGKDFISKKWAPLYAYAYDRCFPPALASQSTVLLQKWLLVQEPVHINGLL